MPQGKNTATLAIAIEIAIKIGRQGNELPDRKDSVHFGGQ